MLIRSGSLHLAYFAAEVTLHRAIIRFDSTHMDETLRNVTRSAAKARFISAIEFVTRLDPTHLQSFWYFASKVNLAIIGTFGSLLWATSDNPEEAEFYKTQLAEYRWTLRVSSKAAEFMKFTVGMLDSSPVFVKDGGSKTTTPNMPRDPPPPQEHPVHEQSVDTIQQEYKEEIDQNYSVNEVSPSVGTSTENAYQYEQDIPGPTMMHTDTRPPWSNFANNINFTPGDIQDWSLDQLYNFENFQVAEDIFASRRFIEEYDETGNNFAGF